LIKGISFVGVAVTDVEEAAKQYREILGLEPWDEGVVEMPGVRAVIFQLGACAIELLQPTVGPESPVGGGLARWLEKRGEGFCRLGLWVDGLDEEIDHLRRQGFEVIDPGQYGRIGEEMGARMAFVHPRSASGVLVELDQQT